MFILDLDLKIRFSEWVHISDKYLRVICLFVIINNLFDGFFCKNILFVVSLDKNVPDIFVLDRDFCDLDFGSAVVLESSNSLSTLTDNEPYSVVWYWNNICIG